MEYAWHWAEDGEGYPFFELKSTNLEEAIIEARAEFKKVLADGYLDGEMYESIWIAEAAPAELGNKYCPEVDDLIASSQDIASFDVGEVAEEWLSDIPDGAKLELQMAINKVWFNWLAKHEFKLPWKELKNFHEVKVGIASTENLYDMADRIHES